MYGIRIIYRTLREALRNPLFRGLEGLKNEISEHGKAV